MPPPRLAPLPRPGEVVTRDFRSRSPCAPSSGGGAKVSKPIRVVQWNIERGYQLEGIIEELRKLDADILSLQEIDIGCARSNWEDTGERIAQELGMNYAFVCEFEEIYSSLRNDRSQGGGVHGNAILSKFDMTQIEGVDHRYQPINWEDDSTPMTKWEPRRGRRLSLVANVCTPQGPLVVFSVHLEVFTGIVGRLEQFSELLRHSKGRISAGYPHQALLGDLNTLGHGIVRWSPQHCNDALRWKTLGISEGKFWMDNVFNVHDPLYSNVNCLPLPPSAQFNRQRSDSSLAEAERAPDSPQELEKLDEGGKSSCISLASCAGGKRPCHGMISDAGAARSASSDAPAGGCMDAGHLNGGCNSFVNRKLLDLGLSLEVCKDLLNPGFEDPFDISLPTLEPEFMKIWGYPLMNGKLDWMLLRSADVVRKDTGNDSYALSDHKWLLADINLGKQQQ